MLVIPANAHKPRANGCRYVSENSARQKNSGGIHAAVDSVTNSRGLVKQSSKGTSVERQFPGNGALVDMRFKRDAPVPI